MTTQPQTDLQQLADTVARLGEAVAAGERRHANTMRGVRWVALAFIVAVSAVVYASSDLIKVYAAQIKNPWAIAENQIAAAPPTLDSVLQSLMGTKELSGAVVKVMQSAAMIASQETVSYLQCEEKRSLMTASEQANTLCFSRAAVEDLGMYYLDENGKLPQPPGPASTQQQQMAYARKMMQGTLMAAGQAIVDGAALVHRLRRDSDLVRHTVNDVGGLSQALSGIEHELNLMNKALISVPAMATEMNMMNRQMSVMSYSVGSTMGRMGDMMPW